MVSKETIRRVGVEQCQSRIEAEPRAAIGTEDRVRLAGLNGKDELPRETEVPRPAR